MVTCSCRHIFARVYDEASIKYLLENRVSIHTTHSPSPVRSSCITLILNGIQKSFSADFSIPRGCDRVYTTKGFLSPLTTKIRWPKTGGIKSCGRRLPAGFMLNECNYKSVPFPPGLFLVRRTL